MTAVKRMKAFFKTLLRSVVLFKSNEFRLTAHDILRKTPALKDDTSPLTLYLDWRHEQIQRLNLHSYRDHPVLGDVFRSYYGKVDRIALVASFLQASSGVQGDVAEFGVYRGHTAAAMDGVLGDQGSEKRLYLFDSFSGMPASSHPLDTSWEKGDLAAQVEDVQRLFKNSSRALVVPGYFSETFPQYPDLHFSFCHVDCDMYTSVQECIAYILPRLSAGGVIVFDDYGFRDCLGAKAAIEEFLGGSRSSFVPLPTGQAVYLRREFDAG